MDNSLGSRVNAWDLLMFGKSFGLLKNKDGSVSNRIYETESIWITPGGINKTDIVSEDQLIKVTADICSQTISFFGEVEPAFDSFTHAKLYNALPKLSSVIYFNDSYVIPDIIVDSSEDPNANDSGLKILNALEQGLEKSIMVKLGSGYFALLTKGASELWISMAETMTAAGRVRDLSEASLSPVFIGAHVGGLVVKNDEQYSLFLNIEYEDSFEEDLVLNMLPSGTRILKGDS